MNVETITSRQNPLMTHLRKLASSRSYRKKSGEYLCDGTKLLDEALKWGAPVQTAVFSDGVEIPTLPDTVRAVRVSGDLMRSVSPMETPQGALFTVALPETKLPETLAGKHYLVLEIFAGIPFFTGFTLKTTLLLCHVGIGCAAIGFLLTAKITEYTSAAEASFVYLIKPVLATVLAVAVYHEQISVNRMVGIAFFVAASLCVSVPVLREMRWEKLQKES